MSSFVFSDLQVLGQIGTTIGLGLVFDADRALVHDPIAALLCTGSGGHNAADTHQPDARPTDHAPPFANCQGESKDTG